MTESLLTFALQHGHAFMCTAGCHVFTMHSLGIADLLSKAIPDNVKCESVLIVITMLLCIKYRRSFCVFIIIFNVDSIVAAAGSCMCKSYVSLKPGYTFLK